MPRLPLPIWLYSTLATLAVVGVAAPLPAPGPPPATPGTSSLSTNRSALPPPPVAFDAAAPLVVDRRDKHGDLTVTVFVKNDGSIEQRVELSAVLLDRDNVAVAALVDPSSAAIQPGAPRALTVALRKPAASATHPAGTGDLGSSGLPLRGHLVMNTVRDPHPAAPPPPPATRELRVTPVMPSPVADAIALRSLVAAVIVVLIGVYWAGPGKIFNHLGSVSWGESWASNAAVGSALLTTVLGLTVFPDYTHFMPKSMYSLLSAIFGALVALSPIVYGLFRSAAPKPGGTIQYRGIVVMFAIGAVLTLWGATGQLVTLFYAIDEVAAAQSLPMFLATSLRWIVGALLVGLLVYGCIGVRQIVRAAEPSSTEGGEKRSVESNTPVAPPAPNFQLL